MKPFHYQADRIMHVFLMVLTDDLSKDRRIGDNGGDNITHRKIEYFFPLHDKKQNAANDDLIYASVLP